MSSFDFSRKVAVVTGAASGLGNQVARDLCAAGASVGLVDLRPDPLSALHNELDSQGSRCRVVAVDVTDEEGVRTGLADLEAELGLPTLLVNCAGIVSHPLAEDLQTDEFRRVLDVNLVAPFILTRALAVRWIAEGSPGSVVNIASVGGFRTYRPEAFSSAVPPRYDGLAYTSSKAGLIHMTRSLARTWAHFGIRVNAVSPGGMRTPMVANTPGVNEGTPKPPPIGYIAETTEVSSAVLFLLSDQASYVTGENVVVDGGASL